MSKFPCSSNNLVRRREVKMKKFFPGFFGIFLCLFIGVTATVAQENAVRTVNGGVLNGKAISLPKPEYPAEARNAGAEGAIMVTITIDESGNVVSAIAAADYYSPKKSDVSDMASEAKPADPLLREACEKAAMSARFSPTLLSGQPVKVTGVIVYNFVASRSLDGQGARTVSGGILNGKATSLPMPAYPPAAKAVKAGGTVNVQIMIDEQGNVISAQAISGHPLLQGAAVDAARQATFSPTLLSGEPVKVTGVVTYTFVAGTKPDNQ